MGGKGDFLTSDSSSPPRKLQKAPTEPPGGSALQAVSPRPAHHHVQLTPGNWKGCPRPPPGPTILPKSRVGRAGRGRSPRLGGRLGGRKVPLRLRISLASFSPSSSKPSAFSFFQANSSLSWILRSAWSSDRSTGESCSCGGTGDTWHRCTEPADMAPEKGGPRDTQKAGRRVRSQPFKPAPVPAGLRRALGPVA